MASYVVMEPGEMRTADADRTVYVRDGFSLIAFLVPILWLLWHRLWMEAALAFAAAVVLAASGQALNLSGWVTVPLSLLIAFYIGLEGSALRISALRRRGWREWGVVEANGRDEAEMRYVAETVDEVAKPVADGIAERAETRIIPSPFDPALGMLGYPGRR
jgi:glucose-6-phosphate-specific signal transduction histidine kinase